MKSIYILIAVLLIPQMGWTSEKACRQVTVMRALAMVDRDNQTKNEMKEIRQLYRFVCENINPSSDIYYPNGVKAYSTKAKDWFYPSDKFAILGSGEGAVVYPNKVKAYSEKALDWFYPSDKLAFLEEAMKPGLDHPMYYPNGVKALSEKAKDWFYPSDKLAFLHKALNKGGADMFYPNEVKAYSYRADNWHYSDDTFAFDDDGSPKLRTLIELSDVKMAKMKFRKMRKLRILFYLNRIDRKFR